MDGTMRTMCETMEDNGYNGDIGWNNEEQWEQSMEQ